jgi:hypothetical protein
MSFANFLKERNPKLFEQIGAQQMGTQQIGTQMAAPAAPAPQVNTASANNIAALTKQMNDVSMKLQNALKTTPKPVQQPVKPIAQQTAVAKPAGQAVQQAAAK